jgi:ABC-type Zn uptake system ZnuABC Zn-binding protein ZnuA
MKAPYLLVVVMLIALVRPVHGQEINIVTTLTTYGSIAREIVGDRAVVTSIARGDEDAHFVQPKPSYVTIIRDADLFVTTAMDLELWVPALLDRAGNRAVLPGGPGYVAASAGVDLMEIPTTIDRSQGDIHIYGNPHLLSDPYNAILVARNILAGLTRVAPDEASLFEERTRRFERRLVEAMIGPDLVEMLTVETALQLLSSRRLYPFIDETVYQGAPLRDRLDGWFSQASVFRDREMVCYHREWSYFSRRFGIPCVGYVEPKLGIPPTPGHVRDLIDLMRRREVRAIFAANYYPRNQINQVADRTGATAVIVPEHTEGAPGIDNYFDLVDVWITSLAAAYR